MTQFQCEVEQLFEVPPDAFYPPPKVQSAEVRLTPHIEPPYPDTDRASLAKVVTQAFSQRRKTLRNNLKGTFSEKDIASLDIDPDSRAEQFCREDFINLTKLGSARLDEAN